MTYFRLPCIFPFAATVAYIETLKRIINQICPPNITALLLSITLQLGKYVLNRQLIIKAVVLIQLSKLHIRLVLSIR
jgi:hypothetical protein